jgi:hypothetical protein
MQLIRLEGVERVGRRQLILFDRYLAPGDRRAVVGAPVRQADAAIEDFADFVPTC